MVKRPPANKLVDSVQATNGCVRAGAACGGLSGRGKVLGHLNSASTPCPGSGGHKEGT